MLAQEDIDTEAATLEERLRSGGRYRAVRTDDRAISIDDAYRVQRALVDLLSADGSDPIRGYKIGWTTKAQQAKYGIDDPVVGVVHESRIVPDGGSVALSNFIRMGLECEIAVVLAEDIPAGSGDVGWNHIASLHAAFELIDNRGANPDLLDAGSMVAHNAWNAGVVLGAGSTTEVDFRDFTAAGTLYRNDEVNAELDGSPVLDGPLGALRWLASRIGKMGYSLKRGNLIMTGALVGPLFQTEPGRFRFEADGLLPVTLTIRP